MSAGEDMELRQGGSLHGISVDELINSPAFQSAYGSYANNREFVEGWLKSMGSRKNLYLTMSEQGFGRYDPSGTLPSSIPRLGGGADYDYSAYPFVPHSDQGYSYGPGWEQTTIADPEWSLRGGNSMGSPMRVDGSPPPSSIRGGSFNPPYRDDERRSGKMAVPPATQYANNMNKDTLSTAANMMESTSQRSPMTITTPAKKIR